jgi:hypothetical protein
MARALSASPRSRDEAKASSAAFCASLAITRDFPAMLPPRESMRRANHSRIRWSSSRSLLSLPPITFPGSPERRGRDKALKAELQPAQAALEPGDQAARDIFALGCRLFFSAGLLFSIASHIPVETAQ